MSFPIGRYRFEGGFDSPDAIQDLAGVYAIFSLNGTATKWLDIGEAGRVQSRLKNHERASCWQRNKNGIIYYAVHYTPSMQQSERMRIEKELRDLLLPSCGDR